MSNNIHDDWRLTNQKKYLYKKQLKYKSYDKPDETWDHDHCVFCWDRIDESTSAAYADENCEHWICEKCFEDFKEMFEWEIVS